MPLPTDDTMADEPQEGYKFVFIPGVGRVEIPKSSGSELDDVVRSTKVYKNLTKIDQVLGLANIEFTQEDMKAAKKEILYEAVPSIMSAVCSAIGLLLVKHNIMETSKTDPDFTIFGQLAPAEGWDAERGHTARYIFLDSICKIIKPVSDVNKTYLTKRYSTFCAEIGVVAPSSLMALNDSEWIERVSLDQKFITDIVAYLETHEERDHQLVSLLKQVKLVWKGYGLAVTNIMYQFVTSANCKIIVRSPVAHEAAQFKTIFENKLEALGDYFQYAKVLKNAQIEALNHANFPTLYAVAVRWAISTGLLTENIARSSSIRTALSDKLMDKEISEELPEGARTTARSEQLDVDYELLGIDKSKAFPKSREEELREMFDRYQASLSEEESERRRKIAKRAGT